MLATCSLGAYQPHVSFSDSSANRNRASRCSLLTLAPIPSLGSWRGQRVAGVVSRWVVITNVGSRQGQADLVSCVEHEVLSADVDLDLNFDSHEDLSSFLDFLQARRDGDSLMQLWSFCKPLTDDLLGAFYDTGKLSGANEVAVQTGLFCGKLANKSTTESSPLDTYAVFHMCLKVCHTHLSLASASVTFAIKKLQGDLCCSSFGIQM